MNVLTGKSPRSRPEWSRGHAGVAPGLSHPSPTKSLDTYHTPTYIAACDQQGSSKMASYDEDGEEQ